MCYLLVVSMLRLLRVFTYSKVIILRFYLRQGVVFLLTLRITSYKKNIPETVRDVFNSYLQFNVLPGFARKNIEQAK